MDVDSLVERLHTRANPPTDYERSLVAALLAVRAERNSLLFHLRYWLPKEEPPRRGTHYVHRVELYNWNQARAAISRASQGQQECPHCRTAYEVYAGSEAFIPETAPEAYQKRLIEQMRDAVAGGLSPAEQPKEGTP